MRKTKIKKAAAAWKDTQDLNRVKAGFRTQQIPIVDTYFRFTEGDNAAGGEIPLERAIKPGPQQSLRDNNDSKAL